MTKKETYYFSHDYNARNDEKILELRSNFGSEGYGIFWMIIETMAENENAGIKSSLIGGLSLGYGVTKDKLIEVINCCLSVELLYEKEGYYYSKRLSSHKEFRSELSRNGTIGAQKKWKKYREDMARLSGGYAKESKGKEKEKGISFNEEKNAVIFEDGSSQKLGNSQKIRMKHDDIKPEEILKGYIT